jgi:hypothetical protein
MFNYITGSKPVKKQIELVSFWNTYQNPTKLGKLR